MSENSEEAAKKSEELQTNPEEAAKKAEELPTNPEEPLKQPAPTEKNEKKAEAAETTPEPKGRGRPKGSKDAKPRIKRIPVAPPEEGEAAAAKPKPVKVRVQEEPEEQEPEQIREEPEAASNVPSATSLPEPPVPKLSPRSQRREHMRAMAAERLAATQARQVRYDRVLDGFLGY